MPICVLGQNHRTAPVELREQLSFSDEKQEQLGDLIAGNDGIHEGVVLSTCNRVELYAVIDSAPSQTLGSLLERVHGIELPQWERTLYYREEEPAIRHLFRVASGLDSMVLGEGQILSQVKEAFVRAHDRNLTHSVLQRVFDDAVACGKRVRTDTKLAEGAVSVAYAAVSLARKIFRDPSSESVLLVGAGDTGRRVARHFQLFGVRDLRVTNRTGGTARALAEELSASWVPWDAFEHQLSQVSIVVTATAATRPVLTEAMIREALQQARRRSMFLIDLSVPRDIDPAVGSIPGVFLYDIDDLQGVVLDGEDQRRAEAVKAEAIIDEQVSRFLDWYRARAAAPVIAEVRDRVEQIRRAEIDSVRHQLDEDALRELDRVSQRIVKKILHTPTVALKDHSRNGDGPGMLRAFRRLFGVKDPAE